MLMVLSMALVDQLDVEPEEAGRIVEDAEL
jgi:hypothetical protein